MCFIISNLANISSTDSWTENALKPQPNFGVPTFPPVIQFCGILVDKV